MHSSTRVGAALLLLALAAPLGAQTRPPAPPPSGPTSGPGVTKPIDTAPAAPTEVGGKTLSQWKHDLTSGDPYVRADAIQAVVLFGPAAAEAVPLLIQRCPDRDVGPRTKAVIALRMVRAAEKDRPKVIEALSQRLWTGLPGSEAQAIVRYEAACSLLFYASLEGGPAQVRRVLGAVAKAAEEPGSCEARLVCLKILRVAGRDKAKGPDPRATNALLKAMHDPTGKVRLEAILGLGAMGRPTDPVLLGKVVTALRQVLYSRDRVQVMWGHVGLLAMDDKLADSSLKALARYLESSDMKVRAEGAHVLGAIGPQAKPCVPALVKHLTDKEPVAIQASLALAAIKDTRPLVLEGLVKQLERKEPTVVAAAATAMGELGVSNQQMLKALKAAADRPGIDKDLKAIIQATLDHYSKLSKAKAG
jgi:HEAT repeat protein